MKQEHKILYKVESGSQLYGTTTPESDVDYTSVFMPTAYDLFSLQKCEYIDNSTKSSTEERRNTAEDTDDQQHSLQRYVHLVIHGNPNLLEILFCKKPVFEDPVFTPLKENASRLISRKVYDSFTGFATSQRKKLEYKSKRFNQLRLALGFFETEYPQSLLNDSKAILGIPAAEWLNKNLTEYKGDKSHTKSFHEGLPLKTIYEKVKAEYEGYGWRVHTDTFETLGYDVKFGAHAVRLFHEGIQLLTTGVLEFPITGQAYDDIMAIRRGEVSLEEFYKICDRYEEENRKAREITKLPDVPDIKWANNYLVETLENYIVTSSAVGQSWRELMDSYEKN
jgi:predicted nucleotidyltransferase